MLHTRPPPNRWSKLPSISNPRPFTMQSGKPCTTLKTPCPPLPLLPQALMTNPSWTPCSPRPKQLLPSPRWLANRYPRRISLPSAMPRCPSRCALPLSSCNGDAGSGETATALAIPATNKACKEPSTIAYKNGQAATLTVWDHNS